MQVSGKLTPADLRDVGRMNRTKMYWVNLAKGDQGDVVHWIIEENNPSTLVGFGWSKKTFMPGDQVTVTMHVAKNGNPVGRPTKVPLNGKTYLPQADSGDDGLTAKININ